MRLEDDNKIFDQELFHTLFFKLHRLTPTERLKAYKDILEARINEQSETYQECKKTTENVECQALITSYEDFIKRRNLVEEQLRQSEEENG